MDWIYLVLGRDKCRAIACTFVHFFFTYSDCRNRMPLSTTCRDGSMFMSYSWQRINVISNINGSGSNTGRYLVTAYSVYFWHVFCKQQQCFYGDIITAVNAKILSACCYVTPCTPTEISQYFQDTNALHI